MAARNSTEPASSSDRSSPMLCVAIHAGDIVRLNLPPQAIRSTDSRASGFRQQFGETAATVQLDALPLPELRERMVVAVKRLIDMDTWERQVAIQQVELDYITTITQQFRGLLQLAEGRST